MCVCGQQLTEVTSVYNVLCVYVCVRVCVCVCLSLSLSVCLSVMCVCVQVSFSGKGPGVRGSQGVGGAAPPPGHQQNVQQASALPGARMGPR